MTNEEVMADPYATQEEKEAAAKLALLERQAHQGALFEDWMRHQAGQMFEKYLEAEINDSKNKWMSATDRDAAEVVRIQAQVFQKVKSWINGQIAAGKIAAHGAKQFREEGVELEGMIKSHVSQIRPE